VPEGPHLDALAHVGLEQVEDAAHSRSPSQ
jgi:hypothetical protein